MPILLRSALRGRAVGAFVVVLLLLLPNPAALAQVGGPQGTWIGHYQTTRAFHGRLWVALSRVEDEWTIQVMSANEHYPSEELEAVDSFRATSDSVRWVLHWGPTEVTFEGAVRGDFIVGELRGRENAAVHFTGVWTAVREAAGRERDGLGERNDNRP